MATVLPMALRYQIVCESDVFVERIVFVSAHGILTTRERKLHGTAETTLQRRLRY